MKKKIFTLFLCALMVLLPCSSYASKPIIATDNTSTPYQAKVFLYNRNTSKKLMGCVDYIYEYCDKVGIDATLVIAMTSIETGYGKSHLFRSYNNPGGLKATHGWMRFKNIKDGYKAMIDKLAVMSGVRKSNTYYFNSCHYIQDLGDMYWVENGCDNGYYHMLLKQMHRITSIEDKTPKEKKSKKEKHEGVTVRRTNTKTNKKIIDKLFKKPKKQSAKDYLLSFNKHKEKNGMNIINKVLDSKKGTEN